MLRAAQWCAGVLVIAFAVGCGDAGPNATVAAIVVAPENSRLAVPETRGFTAQALDSLDEPLVPQPAVVWRSSAPEVATIDSMTGVATAVANGTTVISASAGGVQGATGLTVSPLSPAELQALAQALGATEFGGLAAFVLQTVQTVGTLEAAPSGGAARPAPHTGPHRAVSGAAAAYEGAVGIALEYTYALQGESMSGWFYGVFGWNGIDTTSVTVLEWVMVGAAGTSGALPDAVSGSVTDGAVFAEYAIGAARYFGTSGSASIGGSFGGAVRDCSASQQGITVDCSSQLGTMAGSFAFVAEALAGASYEQAPIAFSGLPAVKVTIAISD